MSLSSTRVVSVVSAALRSPRRRSVDLEAEDELVFIALEYGITDHQAHRRDGGRHHERLPVRPDALLDDVLEWLDERVGRVEPEPPLRIGRHVRLEVDDRRLEVPRL